MTRREFVLSSAAAAAAVAVPGREAGADEGPVRPDAEPPIGVAPALARILALAALAPSSHNVQPWAVRILGPRQLSVAIDPERRLPEVDPAAREMVLSVGCFLENLAQAAAEEGLAAVITPGAAAGGGDVARVELVRGEVVAGGAERIRRRRTLRSGHRPDPLEPDHLAALLSAAGPDAAFFPRGSREAGRIGEATVEAMRQQSYRDPAQRELSRWIRFREREVRARADGLTVGGMEATGLGAFVMHHFFDADSVMGRSFREKGIEQCARQAREGAGFLVLGSADQGTPALLEAGRRFERMALVLRERSIAAHPMSQALEEEPWRAAIAGDLRLPGPIQVVVRVGRVERYPEPVSPRRPLTSFVRA
jgi:hypothetical protein